jgi:hypothetical protein
MVIESEQSMAREHNDGSATEMEFMAFVSFVGEVFCRYETQKQMFAVLSKGGVSNCD